MEDVVIIGAGGFGREVLDLIRYVNENKPTYNVIGFLNDDPRALDGFDVPVPIISAVDEFDDWGRVRAVCAIGEPRDRQAVVERLAGRSVRWATLCHPAARIGSGSIVGEGCIFCSLSGITVNGRVGDHVHMNSKSGAGHDARIGDFCTLSSCAIVNGDAVLEEGAFIGTNGVVLPKARVGAWARVGAGSVVLRNVPAGKTVFGVPAKILR